MSYIYEYINIFRSSVNVTFPYAYPSSSDTVKEMHDDLRVEKKLDSKGSCADAVCAMFLL